MTVIFTKKTTTAGAVAAINGANAATGIASALWAGVARDVAAGSYTKANAVATNKLNRVTKIDSINRVSVMSSIIEVPIRLEDLTIAMNAVGADFIKIPFSAIDIGGSQQLYGITVLGYRKPRVAGEDNYDFIAASPHYGLAPAAADANIPSKIPIRIIDSIYSDQNNIIIKIPVPADGGQTNGIMTRDMQRALLVGNYIVLQLLTSE